jgi:hypothetical protein
MAARPLADAVSSDGMPRRTPYELVGDSASTASFLYPEPTDRRRRCSNEDADRSTGSQCVADASASVTMLAGAQSVRAVRPASWTTLRVPVAFDELEGGAAHVSHSASSSTGL